MTWFAATFPNAAYVAHATIEYAACVMIVLGAVGFIMVFVVAVLDSAFGSIAGVKAEPVWSNRMPDKPGWYWMFSATDKDDQPIPVDIHDSGIYMVADYSTYAKPGDVVPGKWFMPLSVPDKPEADDDYLPSIP